MENREWRAGKCWGVVFIYRVLISHPRFPVFHSLLMEPLAADFSRAGNRMTWKRAALYWAVFLALAAYYILVVRELQQPVAHLTRAPFLSIPEEQVTALEVRRDTSVVRCRRTDAHWELVEPADRTVPSDLVEALVANLIQTPDVEVVAEDSSQLSQFGLREPQSEMTLRRTAGEPVTVRLGAHNPAGTAVYAQRNDSPAVFLIGLNVRYYQDLLFENLRQKGP